MPNSNKTKTNARQVPRLDDSFNKYSPDVVARPVDTYVHHTAPDVGRNYQMLAASLAGIAPHINRYLEDQNRAQVARDEAKGELLYHSTGGERLSWEDIRKKRDKELKKIGVNTSVRNGYLKARMANEANIFKEEMYNAYSSGDATVQLPDGTKVPLSESDDPAVFSLWLNRFTAQYIKDNLGEDTDPEYFAKIFIPQLEKHTNELASRHVSERNDVLYSRVIGLGNMRMTTAIAKLRTPDGGLSDVEEERAPVLKEIQDAIQDMLASGVPHGQVEKVIRDLVITMSLDPAMSRGEDVLYLARDILLPNGHSLWHTGTNALTFVDSISKVSRERYFRFEQEERMRKAAASHASGELMGYVYNDQPIPPEVQQRFCAYFGTDELIRLLHNAETVRRYNFPDTTVQDEKYRQRQADTLINQVQTALMRGENVNLNEYAGTEAWNALTLNERKQLIEMVKGDSAANPLIQQAGKYIDGMATEFLQRRFNKEKGDDYFWDYYRALTSAMYTYAYDLAHRQEAINNPQAFYDAVVRTAREYMEMLCPEGVDYLKPIVEGAVAPTDVNGAIAYVKRQQLEASKQAAGSEQNIARQLYHRMRSGLLEADITQLNQQRKPIKAPADDVKSSQPPSQPAKTTPRNVAQLFTGKGHTKKGQEFGAPRDVYDKKTHKVIKKGGRSHMGTDISMPVGTKIHIPDSLDCKLSVAAVQNNNTGLGGKTIKLRGVRKNNDIVSISLMHLSDIKVKKNQTLNPGDLVALSGNTGVGTGPHLHIEVQVNGNHVDPEKYLFS